MHCRMRIASFVVLVGSCGLAFTRADIPEPIPGERFEALHKLIRRGPGESRWMEIDWHPNIQEARERAAAEGKPLFIWAGSGGAPSAGC
jgi:hypothetical protein